MTAETGKLACAQSSYSGRTHQKQQTYLDNGQPGNSVRFIPQFHHLLGDNFLYVTGKNTVFS